VKKAICLLVLVQALVTCGAAYRPTKYCTPDSKNEETYCRCLIYHPREEFCEDENAPLPSCCRATEKGSKIKACGCCRSVYGSKRDISVQERGSYEHVQPIVEYDIR
jgi:hypothetical protein